MKRLWPVSDSTSPGPLSSRRRLLNSQLIGLTCAVLAVVAHVLMREVFPHTVYLPASLALLVAAAFGGSPAALTATVLLAASGWVFDHIAGLSLFERAARSGLFVLLGAGVTLSTVRLEQERCKAARNLAKHKAREALLEASLDTVADALIVYDDQGAIHSFSKAAERVFGWSVAEARSERIGRFVPPDPEAAPDAPNGKPGETGTGSYRQAIGLRRDGSEFPMELRTVEIGDGGRRLFAAVIRDLTTEREAERRSQALHAQLSQVWSLNSMGEMASVLAHELNQPLSAVANYLRAARTLIARMELDNDDLLEAVSRAGDQAVRAGEIIRTMRDLATRGGLEQKPESMSGIIGEVEFLITLMARDADARVLYDLYKGDDTVMADRIQIQQLVINLVRNAIEAVRKYPNRQLSISTYLDADANIVTTIEDSGPGIDPAVSERLFQPLTSTKPEGMGLGLSISSAIVENHRGRIWVEPSRLGGAAFRFVLARAGQHGDGAGRRADGVRRR